MDVLKEVLTKSKPIIETTNFDSKSFKKNYLNKKVPVVLKGYANNWTAKNKWNLDFLASLENEKPVTLEIGDNTVNETNFFKTDYKTYIENIKKEELKNKEDRAYLTLFNIFERFPNLKADIDFSIFTKYTQQDFTYAWIGPSGTITGFHYDHSHNLLAQIMGRKQLILVSPKDNNCMYTSEKYELAATSSLVDLRNYDGEKYPKFKNAECFSVVLEPGDALFIPKKWWHYVTSLDTSISVNNFGVLFNEMFFDIPMERIKHSLHCRGYYKKNNCTCHMMVKGKRVLKSN